uniref:Bromo domain-containing protein n=1 Tax=Steinernema glaseri TaxID=37863 RepID=A0A1I8A439_9BILA
MEGMKMKLLNIPLKKNKEAEVKTPLRLHIPRHILEEQQAKSTTKPEEGLSLNESLISLDFDTGDDSDAGSTSTTTSNLTAVSKKKRKSVQEDLYSHPVKTVHRRRIDPKVSMGTILTEIVNEMKTLQGAENFIKAVNPKIVPDYHTIIKKEIHLTMIRDRINANGYELRKEFLEDVRLMYDNARLYNGEHSIITDAAKRMFELATKRVAEHDDELMKLEKAINPLLDENDLVGFSFILNKIVQDCRNIPKSYAFHQPVDGKKVPRYYEVIKQPIDLLTIENNIKNHKYKKMETFREEFQLLYDNCMLFNGSGLYSNKAKEILNMADAKLKNHYAELSELEANMNGGIVSYVPAAEEPSTEGEGFQPPQPGPSTARSLSGQVLLLPDR